VAFHVIIDPLLDDGVTVEQIADAMRALKPATIKVDCSGYGQHVLRDLQQLHGIPATALEKRERPQLLEVQRISELSAELAKQKAEREQQDLELRLLREHQKQLRILIERLDRDY